MKTADLIRALLECCDMAEVHDLLVNHTEEFEDAARRLYEEADCEFDAGDNG